MKIKNILANIAGVILIVAIIVENTINISLPYPVYYIKNIFLTCLLIYLLIVFFIFIVNKCVSSSAKPKFKYEPLQLNFDDIELWLEKADVPDILYLKGKDVEYIMLEVQFATIGKNGLFVDKGLFLNDIELSIDKIKEELKNVIFLEENNCLVLWYTENNDPKLFLKVLNELKNSLVEK